MENAITIIKGDDTNFLDDQFIVVAIQTEQDLTGFQAIFKLGDVELTFPDISSGFFEIVLSHSHTLNLPKGKMFGDLKLIDTSSRIRTVSSVIPFIIKEGVKDQITYVNQVLNVTTHINNTTIQINMETAGISKSQAESYLAQMQSYSSSILSSANSSQNNSNASYENMVRARNSANDSANSADSANTALETIESIVPTVSPILQNMEELTSVAENIDEIKTVSDNINNVGSATNSYTKDESDGKYALRTLKINGYPLTSDINISGTTTLFSVNKGNQTNNGDVDILTYSDSTLSFKVDDGTDYAPLYATTGHSGEQFIKTELSDVDVSELSDGTYNVFISQDNNQPYLLNNTIFVQPTLPIDEDTDVIPIMTSNTSPKGSVTCSPSNSYAFRLFTNNQNSIGDGTFTATYTFDTPLDIGGYTFKYTPPDTNQHQLGIYINYFTFYYTDGTNITISRNSSTGDGYLAFTYTPSATKSIEKIDINFYSSSYPGSDANAVGRFQLLQNAILDEHTLWVNNSKEQVDVMERDENAQWQIFNDVLCGQVTVSSGVITSVTQPQFDAYSTTKAHDISKTAHADIRAAIPTKLSDLADSTATSPVAKADTLTGLTSTITELNYCDGVTSNIQQQLNALAQRISVLEGNNGNQYPEPQNTQPQT